MTKPMPGTIQTTPLLPGDQGTAQTLAAMRRLVNESLTDLKLRTVALQSVEGCGRNLECQYRALRRWLVSHWQFVRDPSGIELIHRPERLLDQIRTQGYALGDCDDAAILGAALGKIVGFPARFVVLGFFGPSRPFSHVFTELWVTQSWCELDVTRTPQRPAVTRWKVERV
jgi:transglutaminase-like putative cysteine protease